MDEVELEIPRLRYDVTMPLIEGRAPIEGARLRVSDDRGGTNLNAKSPLKTGDFGLAEINIGSFLPAVAAGWQFIGLPVFSKRKPVYTYVFVRADAGIDGPQDIAGKRIGGARPTSAVSIWIQGLLHERYGVDFSTVTWVGGGMDEQFPFYGDTSNRVDSPDPKKRPYELLLDGEVDVLMGDISDGRTFDLLEESLGVKRLFPDYLAEDMRLYRETSIYTPVHMMVMSRQLAEQNPELAANVYSAFEAAKQMAYDDILNDRAGFSVVYLRERLKEQMFDWGDPFEYGIAANKRTIDAYVRYNYEQGVVSDPLGYEDLFAAATLDT